MCFSFVSPPIQIQSGWRQFSLVAESSDIYPALQFLARFLSASVQVLSKSDSSRTVTDMCILEDGPNIIRKAETYGRSPLQLESSYINPSPKSHNPPPPLILRSHSFSWSETLTSICVALQEIPSRFCSGLEII
jgi:hypothetical protein